MEGGGHRSLVKRGFATRASADRKRCVSDRLRIRRGAINKVHDRGDLRRHRCDVWRQTAAKLTEEVVGRVPLRRRCGPRPRGRRRGSLLRGLGRRSWSLKSKLVTYLAVAVTQTKLKRSSSCCVVQRRGQRRSGSYRGKNIYYLLRIDVRSRY